MYEIEIFKLNEGYGYRVGNCYQEYHPEKEGFVLMTLEEAELYAEAVKKRLEE